MAPLKTKEDAFIAEQQATIEEHLDDENFGIPELCKAIGMSRSQLHLKIKALTNRSTSLLRTGRFQNKSPRN